MVDTDSYLDRCREEYYGFDTVTVDDHKCENCDRVHDFDVDSEGEGVCPSCGCVGYWEEHDERVEDYHNEEMDDDC